MDVANGLPRHLILVAAFGLSGCAGVETTQQPQRGAVASNVASGTSDPGHPTHNIGLSAGNNAWIEAKVDALSDLANDYSEGADIGSTRSGLNIALGGDPAVEDNEQMTWQFNHKDRCHRFVVTKNGTVVGGIRTETKPGVCSGPVNGLFEDAELHEPE